MYRRLSGEQVIDNCLHPVWNETLEIEVPEGGNLVLLVHDADVLKSDSLGKVVAPAAELAVLALRLGKLGCTGLSNGVSRCFKHFSVYLRFFWSLLCVLEGALVTTVLTQVIPAAELARLLGDRPFPAD